MIKGELHVHLNGLFSLDCINNIFIDEEVELPNKFEIKSDLLRTRLSTLKEYLSHWYLLRKIPRERENLKRLIESAFVNLKAENIKFVELRSSIIYIALLNHIKLEEALE